MQVNYDSLRVGFLEYHSGTSPPNLVVWWALISGAVVVVAMVIIVIAWIWARRRRRKNTEEQQRNGKATEGHYEDIMVGDSPEMVPTVTVDESAIPQFDLVSSEVSAEAAGQSNERNYEALTADSPGWSAEGEYQPLAEADDDYLTAEPVGPSRMPSESIDPSAETMYEPLRRAGDSTSPSPVSEYQTLELMLIK